jgi:hypothetical protein
MLPGDAVTIAPGLAPVMLMVIALLLTVVVDGRVLVTEKKVVE